MHSSTFVIYEQRPWRLADPAMVRGKAKKTTLWSEGESLGETVILFSEARRRRRRGSQAQGSVHPCRPSFAVAT